MKDEDAVEMEVFRAGDYGDRGTWTEEQIERLAADYNAQLHEAPLTLDHAQTGPALGWVRALRRVGDRLIAQVALGPGKVRDFLREGGFKKRSVEIQREHPTTGRPYLRAVSLLGAASPAVEGLGPVAFSATPTPAPARGEGPQFLALDGAVMIISEASAAEAGDDAERAHLAALLREEMQRLRKLAAERETQHFVRDLRGRGVTLFAEDEAMVSRLAHQAWSERPEAMGGLGEINADASPLDSLFDWLGGLLAGRALTPPIGEAEAETNTAAGTPLLAVAFSERCDPASAALHQRALLIQNGNPALSYSEALMEAAAQNRNP